MAESKAKKRRFPLYITAEQDAEINEFVDSGYAKSQNDFILIFVGFMFYGEPLSWNKIVGILICIIGMFLINLK